MDGKTEIDFESDEADFRLPQIQIKELMKDLKGRGSYGSSAAELNITEIQYSLRVSTAVRTATESTGSSLR